MTINNLFVGDRLDFMSCPLKSILGSGDRDHVRWIILAWNGDLGCCLEFQVRKDLGPGSVWSLRAQKETVMLLWNLYLYRCLKNNFTLQQWCS